MEYNLVGIAQQLRKRSTDAERKLWRHLRDRQLENFKFRRQEPMGDYVLDYVCYEKGIVIEIDSGQHAIPMQKEKDEERDKWLKRQGFMVLRYWNNEVLTNIEGVLEEIRRSNTLFFFFHLNKSVLVYSLSSLGRWLG